MTMIHAVIVGILVATASGGVTGWVSMSNDIAAVETTQEQQQKQNTERYEHLREDIGENRKLLQELLLRGQDD